MRIGVACYPTYGGSGVVATELGMELGTRGHEVHFVSYEPPARYSRSAKGVSFHEAEAAVYPVFKHPPHMLAMASKIAEVATDENLDVFHVHYAIPHTISACIARAIIGRPEMPIITTLHGTDITVVGKEPSYAPVMKFALRDSDGITTVSEWLQEETRSVFGFDGELEVIPNFIDTERFAPRADNTTRAELASDDEFIVMHISNFRPVKRTMDVVRAFARLQEALPARLVFLGGGPEAASCRKLATELGVKDRVSFLGETPDVTPLLAAADVFMLPSENESFGLAALEALACGVPVIATTTGGIPEVIDDAKTGYLFDIGDTASMANAMIELARDRAKLQKMRQDARASAAERFAVSRVVPLYEEYYERVLARTRGK